MAAKMLLLDCTVLDCTVLDEALRDLIAWDDLDDGTTVVKKGYHKRIHVLGAPFVIRRAGKRRSRLSRRADRNRWTSCARWLVSIP